VKYGVTYDPATREIKGRLMLTDETQLVHYPHFIEVSEDQWKEPLELTSRVDVQGNSLVNKNEVFLSVNKTTLLANGIDSVTITCTGLIGTAQLKVGGSAATVSPADSQVVFTTDTLGPYAIILRNDLNHYCKDSLTITAL
jgi:hypothetical protein